MAIINLPAAFSFTSIKKFALVRAGNTVRSKYTAVRQTVVYPYAIWVLEATLVEYDGAQARAIRSFLAQLEGQKNTFRLPVPGHSKPTTGYAGDCTTNGAVAARATSIAVQGLTASVPVLNEGDYFTINDELKIATSSVASNGTGQATITFMPAMRKPVATGFAVKLQNPTILMHMQDDDTASWGISAPYRHKVNFDAIEVVEA